MAQNVTTTLSSKSMIVEIHRDKPTIIIGERINPTGRKKVLAALQPGDFESVRKDALNQVNAGVAMVDINAGVPDADEVTQLSQVMQQAMAVTDVPLCIDTPNPAALEAALELYQGKA